MLAAKLGKHNPEEVQAIALTVELIHIATLVHDDIIDKAALRRNRSTVVSEFGTDAAVLLGDHLFTYAFEKAASLERPAVLGLLARATSLMCAGEIDQLKQRFQFNLTEQEYFSFLEKKTAALFGASARCGGILAGQDLPVQNALEKFGLHLGLAFQITDDLLDLVGQENVVGKTLRTDIMNGKMTLPSSVSAIPWLPETRRRRFLKTWSIPTARSIRLSSGWKNPARSDMPRGWRNNTFKRPWPNYSISRPEIPKTFWRVWPSCWSGERLNVWRWKIPA